MALETFPGLFSVHSYLLLSEGLVVHVEDSYGPFNGQETSDLIVCHHASQMTPRPQPEFPGSSRLGAQPASAAIS